jgi:hypothetical protein
MVNREGVHSMKNAEHGITTISGQSWNTILRFYGPREPYFEKIWQPGEIELVK